MGLAVFCRSFNGLNIDGDASLPLENNELGYDTLSILLCTL